ncbi:MAG: hormogonium polysaccharide biosynthesis protein HpsA, partial [Pseudanabaenales cyanobacterium]|nr:hormogonium polysaccharide biosynthesis protein HpsA [Pseudanabaenales cyanobacterium]
MSTQKRPKAKPHLIDWAWKRVNVLTKGLMTWLLRGLFVIQRPARFSRAGFVLPTVVMVSLVVTLLTVAVMVRSFDRAQSASNYRVNQEVLNASLPALDRARAKIIALLADNRLGTRGTPSEIAIDDVLRLPKFNLGDEARLKIIDDIDGDGTPGEDRSEVTEGFVDEELTTNAWRFPVDTDNNGLFDSFTLYSILFRTPNVNAAGNGFERPRSPLEARALPLDQGVVSGRCAAASGTSASLVGNAGWFLSEGQIKKSFFVYVSTVPITNLDDDLGPLDTADYEVNRRGGRAFSAIEYQQDQARIPLSNNAVLYEDDLDIASGPPLRINGRVFTNSNLFLTEFSGPDQGPLEFYQVSSPESCFYEPENAKIVVGGNVTYGTIEDSGRTDNNNVRIDLYDGPGVEPKQNVRWNRGNDSVTNESSLAGYNTQAYEERIAELARLAKEEITDLDDDPQGVKTIFTALTSRPVNPLPPDVARDRAYDRYFRERTRRVPYAEVLQGTPALNVGGGGPITLGNLQGLGAGGNNDELRPPEEWIYPFETTNDINSVGTNFSELTLNFAEDDQLEPAATQFEMLAADEVENHLGDRVLIGNNLPELDLRGVVGWVGDDDFIQDIKRDDATPIKWDTPEDAEPRQRQTRVKTLDDLGDIGRDGFWETKAATTPENPLIPEGGLRIVTGAGIYLPPSNPTLGSASAVVDPPNVVIWPDTMPVIPDAYNQATLTPPSWLDPFPTYIDSVGPPLERPILRMRASAVYHYRDTDDTPIACVDNYYDPTNSITAARADNGRVYEPPTAADEGNVIDYLRYLANQVHPNGRPVNQLLRDALPVPIAERTLAQQSAVDAAICGLKIFNTLTTNSLSIDTLNFGAQSGYELQDGVIKEIAFLDPRQIKAIDAKIDPADPAAVAADPAAVNVDALPENEIHGVLTNELNSEYKLPIEQREPLEVRVTQISIDDLRNSRADTGNTTDPDEYMLPNSGIIYATRNDALTDRSELGQPTEAANERVSANDFLLDPTRRPSAIMLENGKTLGRRTTYDEVEKGLTLVSNLPVYVKGEFNPHENGPIAREEFIPTLNINDYSNFYTRNGLNGDFACRPGDPRLPCPDGDQWRVANILSDALTLLSEGFQPGARADGDFDLRNSQTDNLNDNDGDGDGFDDDWNIRTADSVREKRLENGFLNNNFVTNGLSQQFADNLYVNGNYVDNLGAIIGYDNDGDTNDDDSVDQAPHGSSYFNNFVTPVQRRVRFPEYVMEICRKLPVSDCEPNDWVVGYDSDGNGILEGSEPDIKANALVDTLGIGVFDLDPTTNPFDPAMLGAGTTARPPLAYEKDANGNGFFDSSEDTNGNGNSDPDDDSRYARRVAFLRWKSGMTVTGSSDINLTSSSTEDALVLDAGTPIPLGIAGDDDSDTADGALAYYPYSATLTIEGEPFNRYSSTNKPRLRDNALWYRTLNGADENYGYRYPLDYVNRADAAGGSPAFDDLTGNISNEQPLLVPVLNIQYPAWPLGGASPDPGQNVPPDDLDAPDDQAPKGSETNWLQPAQLTPDKDAVTFNIVMATGDVPGRPT